MVQTLDCKIVLSLTEKMWVVKKNKDLTSFNGSCTLVPYSYDRGFSMNGTIRCNKCFNAMVTSTCSRCGYPICYIYLYWQGKRYKFWKDRDGGQLDYRRATRLITVIRSAIDNKTFNPDDFTLSKVKERLVENKLNDWLYQKSEEEQADELSPETIRHYKSYVKNHFIPFFKGLDVKEVEFHHIENFKDQLPKSLKIKTRRNTLNALHSFFTWLRRKGIIKEVPNFPEIRGNDAKMRTSIDVDQQKEALKNYRSIIEISSLSRLRRG